MLSEDDPLIAYQRHRDFSIIPTHVIDRLHGSIPQSVLAKNRERIKAEILRIRKHAQTLPEKHRSLYIKQATHRVRSEYEGFLENTLHGNSNGPYYLEDAHIAQLVIDAWLYQAEHKELVVIAICVMSNHVHTLVRGPDSGEVIKAGPILNSVKSFTARKANQLLDRTGSPFWDVYFDRDVRDEKFMTVLWYIVNNPVKAGLVDNWQAWPNTYVNPEYIDLLVG